MLFMLCFVKLLILSVFGRAYSRDVIVNLSGMIPSRTNSEVYSSMAELASQSSLSLIINGTPLPVKFLVVQAHSYQQTITVSYSPDLNLSNHVNGTNVGLFYDEFMIKIFHIFNFHSDTSVLLYISIHAYYEKAPIPGGCNMEANVLNAPYLTVKEDFNTINVEAAAGRVSTNNLCDAESQLITHTFYQLYMPEGDTSNDTYFDMLKNMITVESILKNGHEAQKPFTISHMKRMFSAYHGIGSVYAVIASKDGYSSAYVPNHSYASAVYNGNFPLYMKILFPFISLLGLILSFCGHFYNAHVLVFGFTSCSVLTLILTANFVIQVPTWINIIIGTVALIILVVLIFYNCLGKLGILCNFLFTLLILYMIVDLPFEEIFAISVTAGLISSMAWVLCLKAFGHGMAAIVLSSFCIGFQIAMIIFYTITDLYPILQSNLNYWSIYFMVILIVMLCIFPTTHTANSLASSIIGSFTALVAIELALGSYLRYMFVNIIRRCTVDNFNNAAIMPPYQWRDGIATLIWAILAIIGFIAQRCFSKNRDGERLPLLQETHNYAPSAPWLEPEHRGLGPYWLIHNNNGRSRVTRYNNRS